MFAVWGGIDDEVIAVGENLSIYKYDGSRLEKIDNRVTRRLRKRYCTENFPPDGMCHLNHVAGSKKHGYYFSTEGRCQSGKECIMLRYYNGKFWRKKNVCGAMWMGESGTLWGYTSMQRSRFYKMKGMKISYYQTKIQGHITSMRGRDEKNIYAIGPGSYTRKFNGEKWIKINPKK
jgi:hypothetical protein